MPQGSAGASTNPYFSVLEVPVFWPVTQWVLCLLFLFESVAEHLSACKSSVFGGGTIWLLSCVNTLEALARQIQIGPLSPPSLPTPSPRRNHQCQGHLRSVWCPGTSLVLQDHRTQGHLGGSGVGWEAGVKGLSGGAHQHEDMSSFS